MEDEKLKVIYLEAGKRARTIEISDTLTAMQTLVQGSIEEYMPFEDDVAIVCNSEGKIRGLDPNRAVYGENGEILDIIQGDFFLCYARPESESYESMPPELEEKYRKRFEYPEQFFKVGKDIRAVKYDPDPEKDERRESR